jgi:hypothetical protein
MPKARNKVGASSQEEQTSIHPWRDSRGESLITTWHLWRFLFFVKGYALKNKAFALVVVGLFIGLGIEPAFAADEAPVTLSLKAQFGEISKSGRSAPLDFYFQEKPETVEIVFERSTPRRLVKTKFLAEVEGDFVYSTVDEMSVKSPPFFLVRTQYEDGTKRMYQVSHEQGTSLFKVSDLSEEKAGGLWTEPWTLYVNAHTLAEANKVLLDRLRGGTLKNDPQLQEAVETAAKAVISQDGESQYELARDLIRKSSHLKGVEFGFVGYMPERISADGFRSRVTESAKQFSFSPGRYGVSHLGNGTLLVWVAR